LSNFLAYCLGIRTVDVDLDEVSPLKVVALYKAAFNVLDKPSKSRALRELLMRISLDPQLRDIFALARAGR
jgi:hypothetical protein